MCTQAFISAMCYGDKQSPKVKPNSSWSSFVFVPGKKTQASSLFIELDFVSLVSWMGESVVTNSYNN